VLIFETDAHFEFLQHWQYTMIEMVKNRAINVVAVVGITQVGKSVHLEI
jgi:hypothetical protein